MSGLRPRLPGPALYPSPLTGAAVTLRALVMTVDKAPLDAPGVHCSCTNFAPPVHRLRRYLAIQFGCGPRRSPADVVMVKQVMTASRIWRIFALYSPDPAVAGVSSLR